MGVNDSFGIETGFVTTVQVPRHGAARPGARGRCWKVIGHRVVRT
jgi:hypothetical protein